MPDREDPTNLNTGELIAYMKLLKKESKTMMDDLLDVDNELSALQNSIEAGALSNDEITEALKEIRLKIGVLEKEDTREMDEEEIADTLLTKLKKWMNMVI